MREILDYFSEALGVPEEHLPSYVLYHRRRHPFDGQDGTPLEQSKILTGAQKTVFRSSISRMGLPNSLGEDSSGGGSENRRAH